MAQPIGTLELMPLMASQHAFTKALYKALSKESSANVFFSPFSILTAMGMVHAAAKNDTLIQMKNVLHFPSDNSVVHEAFRTLLPEFLKKHDGFDLRTSNSVYISNQLSNILEDFSSVLREDFQSTFEVVNFDNHEIVRQNINAKVEKDTNSCIKDLIPQGVLNSMVRMILVNAIYFKGFWEKKFNSSATKPRPFWITKDKSVEVPMMFFEKDVNFCNMEDIGVSVLKLNYEGNRLHMTFILPHERDGLDSFINRLDSINFNEIEKKLHSMKVRVSIPKFKLEESVDMVSVFKKMGLLDLFDDRKCDLSGITGKTEGLFVSNIFHKAFIDVNEEGTEAAAATAVIMMTRCMRITLEFVADHPFFFYIKDNLNGHILFSGHYKTPAEVIKEEL